MKFTLRQLEFYVALAETLQISKAAGRCHISQSSMTVAMRNLETIMNTQLFVRHPKGIELTVDGERFLSHARTILSASEAAINDLHNQPEMTTGSVRVGIAETLSAYLLPGIYNELERRFPHRCPDPKDSEREIWMKAGERRLVDFLQSVHRDQQDNILNV